MSSRNCYAVAVVLCDSSEQLRAADHFRSGRTRGDQLRMVVMYGSGVDAQVRARSKLSVGRVAYFYTFRLKLLCCRRTAEIVAGNAVSAALHYKRKCRHAYTAYADKMDTAVCAQ